MLYMRAELVLKRYIFYEVYFLIKKLSKSFFVRNNSWYIAQKQLFPMFVFIDLHANIEYTLYENDVFCYI